jgi:hypothetical protein
MFVEALEEDDRMHVAVALETPPEYGAPPVVCAAAPPGVVRGENGHAALSAEGLGEPLLALFDKLVRGASASDGPESVRALVENVLADARARQDAEGVKNLFVMAFQTRWCRGGKAERKLFYVLLTDLYARFPAVVLGLLRLVPEYGYWKDLLALVSECAEAPLHAAVWALFAQQLQADTAELASAQAEGRVPKISLCAKYAPSEGGAYSKALRADRRICELLFAEARGADVSWHHVGAKYRRMLSALRRQLSVTETYMCARRWSEIDFQSVPSLCMDRQKRAFLNEDAKGMDAHPLDPARVACRERLLKHIADKGLAALKGKQLFPHELVAHVQTAKGGRPSAGVAAVLNVQWAAVRAGLLAQVEARRAELARAAAAVESAEALELAAAVCPDFALLSIARDVTVEAAVASGATRAIGLNRVVPMADVSGSMNGTPMLVSIALGILVSEITHESFRDKVLTFHECPRWHDLSGKP